MGLKAKRLNPTKMRTRMRKNDEERYNNLSKLR
jgi:hypothetical protein